MDRFIQSILAYSLVALLVGCGGEDIAKTPTGSDSGLEPAMALNVNTYPMNKLVCDPFEHEDSEVFSFGNGLVAELYYTDDSSTVGSSVTDYIDRGRKSHFNFFFNSLNIRTQNFFSGFIYESGGLVHDHLGKIIHDHFALKITGNIQLSSDQLTGDYEFSLLSDDGAIFKIFYQGEWVDIINNDGVSRELFSCGTQSFHLEKGKSYPIEMHYFQSSKSSPIMLVPLWRLVPKNQKADPFCQLGRGNHPRFFDINNRSLPLAAYNSLVGRKWSPIIAENLTLPPEVDFNPCADSKQIPIISHFQFSFTATEISVQWETDIPATSQVVYTRSDTGVETLTQSDNILRTTHSVKIPKNPSGVSYIVRAISISETFGKAISGGYTIHGFY